MRGDVLDASALLELIAAAVEVTSSSLHKSIEKSGQRCEAARGHGTTGTFLIHRPGLRGTMNTSADIPVDRVLYEE
jgi:hypothetical protein